MAARSFRHREGDLDRSWLAAMSRHSGQSAVSGSSVAMRWNVRSIASVGHRAHVVNERIRCRCA
jgi:hypothetical protein